MSSSILALTMFAPVAGAQVFEPNKERLQIEVANVDINVSKDKLIKKFKALFPGKFNHLTEKDFQLNNTGHYYHNDPTLRYELSFNHKVNGKNTYGSVVFAGDDYEIEQFYYIPADTKEALFPAKVSKDEARDIATKFVKSLPGGDYTLQSVFNYSFHTVLTEPINYQFTFARMHNGVPIADQTLHVGVLGTGDITALSQPVRVKKEMTFDDVSKVLSKEEMLAKYKAAYAVDLYYTVDYGANQPSNKLQLIYRPNANIYGIQAATGKWQTANDFSSSVPAVKRVKPVAEKPLQTTSKPMTVEQVKKKAEELLKIDSKKAKLIIHSIDEIEQNGVPIYSVNYMYESGTGGYGGALQFVKDTGEIVQYHNVIANMYTELDEGQKPPKLLSEMTAKNYAIQYLKEFMPASVHQYSEPLDAPYVDRERGTYSFAFPKLVNGIPSLVEQVSVGIASDGELLHLYSNQYEVKEITPVDGIVSGADAKSTLLEALDLKLQYVRHGVNQNHYHLVYSPVYANDVTSVVDATTGELQDLYGKKATATTVEHPLAADQLNYLIQTGILDISKKDNFNADAPITKGETLEVLVKSLSYFYYEMYAIGTQPLETISNIAPNDPYYAVVERARTLGIVDAEKDVFQTNDTLTREELAVWFIRVLGLAKAADQPGIYKLAVTDAATVSADKVGYVALANALGVIPTTNNQFKPQADVTYAELAVAIFDLAYEIAEKNSQQFYR